MSLRLAKIFVVWVTTVLTVSAQQVSIDSIMVYSFAEGNKVMLKWLISSQNLYAQAKLHGFEVVRYDLKVGKGKPELSNPAVLTKGPIFPLTVEQIKAQAVSNPDLKKALFFDASEDVLNKQYNDLESSYTANDYSSLYMGLGIFSVASNNSVAKANGMYFEDLSADVQKEYAYKVTIVGNPKFTGVGIYKYAEATKKYKVSEATGKMYKTRVNLRWYHNVYSNIVYYNIYRSTQKDKGYVKVNKLPYMGDVTGGTKSKGNYKDLTDSVALNQTYYYKIVGVNMFEREGIASEVVRVNAFKQLEFAPLFKSVLAAKPGQVLIEWETEKVDLPWIKDFDIYHSYQPEKNFKKLNKKPLSGKTFSYLHEGVTYSSNYYLICEKGKGGDSVFSNTKMILLEDNTPPIQPVFVSGVCDTNGIVTLKWKQNKELDLLGYRLFRVFDNKSEPTRVTDGHVIDTTYVDTLGKRRIDRKVYYTLYALDNHVNPSIPSALFSVRVPDRLKPAVPQIQSYKVTEKGIALTLIKSSSEDLMEQHLFRKSEYDFDWQPIMKFRGDSLQLTSVLDTNTKSKVWYQYAMQAIDSSGNKSAMSQPFRLFQEDKNPIPKVKNLQAFVSKPNKKVKLVWEFTVQAGSFTIYRGSKGNPPIEYTTVKGDKREFYDDLLTPNTKYTYQVIANLPNYKPSLYSDLIEVKY